MGGSSISNARTPGHAALRAAGSAGLAALLVGIAGLPQPFLAVLATTLLNPLDESPGEIPRRLGGAWAGTLLGAGILTLFPEQPWFAFPTLAIAGGLAARRAAARLGHGAATVFAMGLGASFPAGAIHPAIGPALAHAGSLSLAIVAVGVVAALAPRPRVAGSSGPRGRMDPIGGGPRPYAFGVALSVAVVFGMLVFPSDVVPLSVCAAVTALKFCDGGPPADAGWRGGGAVFGGVAGAVFVVLVSSVESLPVFLLGLSAVLGGLEFLAGRSGGRAGAWRQAAGVFAVAATIFPAPAGDVADVVVRAAAVVAGFLVAAGVALLSGPPVRGALARPPRMAHDNATT